MGRLSTAISVLMLLGTAAAAQVPTYQGPGGAHAKCNEVLVLDMANNTLYPPETVFFGVRLSDWTPETVAFLKALVDRCTRGRNLRSDYVPELYAAIDAFARMPAQQRAAAEKKAAEDAKQQAMAKCQETNQSKLYSLQEGILAGIEWLANLRKQQAQERRVAQTSGVSDLIVMRKLGEAIVESEDELKADFAEYKRLGGKAASPEKVTHQLSDPCVAPAAVVVPAVQPGPPSFEDQFVCPESLPDQAAREKQVKDFFEWASATHPQSTVKEILDMRLHMLETHHCTQTLENIRRNN